MIRTAVDLELAEHRAAGAMAVDERGKQFGQYCFVAGMEKPCGERPVFRRAGPGDALLAGLVVLVFAIVKSNSYGWGSARTIGAATRQQSVTTRGLMKFSYFVVQPETVVSQSYSAGRCVLELLNGR